MSLHAGMARRHPAWALPAGCKQPRWPARPARVAPAQPPSNSLLASPSPPPRQVSLNDLLYLNNITATAALPINLKLKLPKWDETCPPDGVPAVLPSDTVQCRVTSLQMNENLSVLAERVRDAGDGRGVSKGGVKIAGAAGDRQGAGAGVPPASPVPAAGGTRSGWGRAAECGAGAPLHRRQHRLQAPLTCGAAPPCPLAVRSTAPPPPRCRTPTPP